MVRPLVVSVTKVLAKVLHCPARCAATLAVLALLLALTVAEPAPAQELFSSIATAEQRAESARGEVGELKKELAPVASRYSRASRRARDARSEVQSAKADVATIKAERDTQRAAAATRLRRLEDGNRESEQKHDDRITSDIGLGIAAMVMALLILAWDWFRASAPVAGLTRLTAAQAVGLCVGGGFLAVVTGAVMEGSGGLMAVLGTALVFLGLTLPAAFLLARHSAEIQRGRAKPWLGRERFPARVTQVLAAILGVVCLVALGVAAFAPQAHSNEIPTGLTGRGERRRRRSRQLRARGGRSDGAGSGRRGGAVTRRAASGPGRPSSCQASNR